jgi:ATP-dependent Clp endopeptidase proteolytic subunit ClpP
MRKWYQIQQKANGTETVDELTIFDEIGFWGVEAKDFAEQIKQLSGNRISLLINSPGGSVFDAVMIFNALKMTGKQIDVKVMGIAASAASYIAMVASPGKLTMPNNTMMMLHKPLNMVFGNAAEMREMADTLDKVALSVEAAYRTRSKMDEEKLQEIMSKDSFLTADECLELGLCDTVVDAVTATAHFDPTGLPSPVMKLFEDGKKVAMNEADPVTDPVVDPVTDPVAKQPHRFDPTHTEMVGEIVAASGLGAEYVDVFALDDTLTNREQVVEAITQAREIVALCNIAKQPQLAVDHIRLRNAPEKVRQELRMVVSKQDEATHTSNVKALVKEQAGREATPASINPTDIYAKRSKQQRGAKA